MRYLVIFPFNRNSIKVYDIQYGTNTIWLARSTDILSNTISKHSFNISWFALGNNPKALAHSSAKFICGDESNYELLELDTLDISLADIFPEYFI